MTEAPARRHGVRVCPGRPDSDSQGRARSEASPTPTPTPTCSPSRRTAAGRLGPTCPGDSRDYRDREISPRRLAERAQSEPGKPRPPDSDRLGAPNFNLKRET